MCASNAALQNTDNPRDDQIAQELACANRSGAAPLVQLSRQVTDERQEKLKMHQSQQHNHNCAEPQVVLGNAGCTALLLQRTLALCLCGRVNISLNCQSKTADACLRQFDRSRCLNLEWACLLRPWSCCAVCCLQPVPLQRAQKQDKAC